MYNTKSGTRILICKDLKWPYLIVISVRELQTIKVENENGITTITLNRPDRRNAMNPQLHFEMCDTLEDLAHDPETRVLILTGAGESFCAGQDLKEYFYDLADKPRQMDKARSAAMRWKMELLRLFPAPTIASVNGFCFGAGLWVVSVCDLAIAADEAVFGLSEINWGAFPGVSLPKVIPELVPFRDALYYSLTGDTFDGRKASEIRFVNYSVPGNSLRSASLELANKLKEKDPAVLRATKEVFKIGRYMDYEQMAAWAVAKQNELRLTTANRWKSGVEQFKAKKYKPGFDTYDWQEKNVETQPKNR